MSYLLVYVISLLIVDVKLGAIMELLIEFGLESFGPTRQGVRATSLGP